MTASQIATALLGGALVACGGAPPVQPKPEPAPPAAECWVRNIGYPPETPAWVYRPPEVEGKIAVVAECDGSAPELRGHADIVGDMCALDASAKFVNQLQQAASALKGRSTRIDGDRQCEGASCADVARAAGQFASKVETGAAGILIGLRMTERWENNRCQVHELWTVETARVTESVQATTGSSSAVARSVSSALGRRPRLQFLDGRYYVDGAPEHADRGDLFAVRSLDGKRRIGLVEVSELHPPGNVEVKWAAGPAGAVDPTRHEVEALQGFPPPGFGDYSAEWTPLEGAYSAREARIRLHRGAYQDLKPGLGYVVAVPAGDPPRRALRRVAHCSVQHVDTQTAECVLTPSDHPALTRDLWLGGGWAFRAVDAGD